MTSLSSSQLGLGLGLVP